MKKLKNFSGKTSWGITLFDYPAGASRIRETGCEHGILIELLWTDISKVEI
jgi:hypothetical protein